MACDLRMKIVPRFVSLAVCNWGSQLFVAGAYHTYVEKTLAFVIFYSAPAPKKIKHHRPCHDAVLTYLVLLYHMQQNDGSRQLRTYLPTTHLPSAVYHFFADNTTNQLESYRHQS